MEIREGSFLSHLVELRDRLLRAVLCVGAVFAALVYFAQDLYLVVAKPLMAALPEGNTMIATEVASPFLTPIKLTLWVSLLASMPFVLYQIWAFVAPGLYKHERRLALPIVASTAILFYLGMTFAYFVVFPLVFGFFTSVAPAGVQVMTDIRSYLDFVFGMFFAFGVTFEIPVALVLLTAMGVVDPDQLATKRPYVVLWAFVISMLLTPPDMFSQTLLALPMLLLFEIGLFVSRRLTPRGKRRGEEGDEDLDIEHEIARFDRDIGGS